MASGIDHLVIGVNDPDAAAAELTETVGLAFTAGGRHVGLGTFNRIAFLGDAYLELMGVDDPAAAAGWPIGAAAIRAIDNGGGFATWALLDDGIRASVAQLRANGSGIGPVVHGSRQRPDGEGVEWWTASPPRLDPDRPPFLIRHLAAGSEWGSDALATRRAFVHPLGSTVRLTGLDLAPPDLFGFAGECLAQVGLGFALVGNEAVAATGAQRVRLVEGPALSATVRLRIESGPVRSVRSIGLDFVLSP